MVIPDRESPDRARDARFFTLDAVADAVFASFRAVDARFSPYKEAN